MNTVGTVMFAVGLLLSAVVAFLACTFGIMVVAVVVSLPFWAPRLWAPTDEQNTGCWDGLMNKLRCATNAPEASLDGCCGVVGMSFATFLLVAAKHVEWIGIWPLIVGPWATLLFFGVSFMATGKVIAWCVLERPQETIPDTAQTARRLVRMGSTVGLFLASLCGWCIFGLGRFVSEPTFRETAWTVSTLVGCSGLLLVQRWARG
jgi:hypothetical protein